MFIFAGCASEDNEDNDDDDDNEEENCDEDTHDEDNKEDDANESNDNKNEYDENHFVNDNDEDNTMPPKLKPAPQPPKKGKNKKSQVEKLTSTVSKKLNITTPPPAKPYSMTTLDGYIVKPYTHRFVDFVEVNIHVAGPLSEHAYKAKLSENGMSLIRRRAIPDYFFESKWMVSMLKTVYHPKDTRVIAHDNVVQHIRKGGTESKGLHFAAEEDAMIVPLGVVCTGNVRVTEDLKKMGKVVYAGHTHFQLNMIYSCRVRTMKLRTMQKKKGEAICSC